jgi:DNA-binding NtrC family response regulator
MTTLTVWPRSFERYAISYNTRSTRHAKFSARDNLPVFASNNSSRDQGLGVETYGDLLGRSPAMKHLFEQLRRLEKSRANLMISGESGTGKELIARAVHAHSPLRHGPLVTVNCGALERQLVRSELFGHERGAFTGAVRRHVGAFEAAHGGTLFLDEVGELPRDVQPVLLRALEVRKIVPVGSVDERPIDVRLITASHRDLSTAVSEGNFREDLMYRIRVVELAVPPLRQRLEDIAPLVQAFAQAQGMPCLPTEAMDAFTKHHWPGNVRELRNAVEAFLAIGALPQSAAPPHDTALGAALTQFINPKQTYADQKDELLRRFTRAYVERVLESTAGNQTEAAHIAGLERSYFGRLLSKLGVRRAAEVTVEKSS